MPWTDVQFWLVTAAAVVSVWVLIRPWLRRSDGPACGSCASGSAACASPKSPPTNGDDASLVVLGRR